MFSEDSKLRSGDASARKEPVEAVLSDTVKDRVVSISMTLAIGVPIANLVLWAVHGRMSGRN